MTEAALLYWHWLVLAGILAVADFATRRVSLLWWWVATLAMAAASALLPGLAVAYQLLAWAVLSFSFALLWFAVVRPRLFAADRQDLARDDAIGEAGTVIRVQSAGEKVFVQFDQPVLGSREWYCVIDGEAAVGDTVHILDFSGPEPRVVKL